MLQELSTKTTIAQIGEEIGLDLGTQMVKSYQEANPLDVKWYLIGRDIIEQILAQPNCVAIKFFNALNEFGQKTLVYIGINANGDPILEYTVIDTTGQLKSEQGIVADRIKVPGSRDVEIGDDNIFTE